MFKLFYADMTPTPAAVQLISWESTIEFYCQTMEWWLYVKQNMEVDYIEFRYEDAVEQFEPTFHRVFEFLELLWDPEVVKFHRHAAKKTINSPSFKQVTQPLYRSSVARWKHYAEEYHSIAELLQPYISAFKYRNE